MVYGIRLIVHTELSAPVIVESVSITEIVRENLFVKTE